MTIYKEALIKINQKIINYVPGTCTVQTGGPTRMFLKTVNGKTFVSEDIKEDIPFVKFELYSVDEQIRDFDEWKVYGNTNVITAVKGDKNISFNSMAIVNTNPEKDLSPEGTFTVEFKGENATTNK
jgi:hypothetical protein